jgi:MFS family permease
MFQTHGHEGPYLHAAQKAQTTIAGMSVWSCPMKRWVSPLGLISASAVFLLLSKSFATTGWRIAMLLFAIIVIPALVARYKLADSPLFEQLKRREQLARMPSLGVLRRHTFPSSSLAQSRHSN